MVGNHSQRKNVKPKKVNQGEVPTLVFFFIIIITPPKGGTLDSYWRRASSSQRGNAKTLIQGGFSRGFWSQGVLYFSYLRRALLPYSTRFSHVKVMLPNSLLFFSLVYLKLCSSPRGSHCIETCPSWA